MELKRPSPTLNTLSSNSITVKNEEQEDLSQFQLPRKRIKKDSSYYWDKNHEYDDFQIPNEQESNMPYQSGNLFQLEFQNLKACSFKTISKIGMDKINVFNKNQYFDFEGNIPQSGRKRKQSMGLMSDQKLKNSQPRLRSRKTSFQKEALNFGSLKQIPKLQNKNSAKEIYNLNNMRKIQSSFSSINQNQFNTINTQMMNDLMEFNIKDQQQIDQFEIQNLHSKALIKNIKFTGNLLIQKKKPNQSSIFLQNSKLSKILNFDGFTINGLYVQNQKIRIHLGHPITNKQFQKIFALQTQSHMNIHKASEEKTKYSGAKFDGVIYNNQTRQKENISLYLSDIKDNTQNEKVNQVENINYQNMEINYSNNLYGNNFTSNFYYNNAPFKN